MLDECVPRSLREQLTGHEVKTVAESGWARVKNGELLRLAAQRFDVVVAGPGGSAKIHEIRVISLV